MFERVWRRGVVAASVALVAVAAGVGTATAETRTMQDQNEQGTLSDTSSVTVVHRYASGKRRGGRVLVRAQVGNIMLPDRFDVWIDVPGGPAPEFHAFIPVESSYGPVRRVDGWGRTGPAVCRSWDARAVAGRDRTVVASIPRSCLGNPGKVRVTFLARYAYAQKIVRDWVPGRRTLGPWVPVS